MVNRNAEKDTESMFSLLESKSTTLKKQRKKKETKKKKKKKKKGEKEDNYTLGTRGRHAGTSISTCHLLVDASPTTLCGAGGTSIIRHNQGIYATQR